MEMSYRANSLITLEQLLHMVDWVEHKIHMEVGELPDPTTAGPNVDEHYRLKQRLDRLQERLSKING